MNIAFASYETPFAPCGGIAAVMGRLPARVAATSHLDTIVVTPFHHQIAKMASLGRSHEGVFGVDFQGRTVVCHVYRHDDRLPYYFILPEDSRFFAGRRHPYDVGGDDLLRDALLFGAALPRALATINPGKRWTLLLQDWEAATAVLASAEAPGRPRSFVTLHNSYDANVSDGQLAELGFNPQACPGQTVLQRALALTELPVFTVSEQFAHDLCEDVLQTQVLAPHLQLTLKPRLVGIDNGPFVELAVDPQALAEAQTGRFDALARWKADNRKAFLSALAGLKSAGDRPVWGDVRQFRQDDAPWFVMAGRDDSRQKGYDVATRAAELFLEGNGDSRFLFFPIPGDEGLTGLGFLQELAERFPQNVLVFPFLFREGFVGALRGANFGIMPSLYEPFGMANEFYLNGTVGIGRATGGIVQQIVPLRSGPAWNGAVQSRADRWHDETSAPTGFLFHEPDGAPSEASDWRAINAAGYNRPEAGLDRVQERSSHALFASMATELHHALSEAARIAREDPQVCFRLLTGGIRHIRQNFSWDRAALEYIKHIV